MISGAEFSPCRTWRYRLWRIWDAAKPAVLFIGINPSTADETINDPTVTRCMRYAEVWGYGSVLVCNLFAFRSTRPQNLWTASDPIGPANDAAIIKAATQVLESLQPGRIVCAWGNHGAYLDRSTDVLVMLEKHLIPVHCLAVTRGKEPAHPLYLRADLMPQEFIRPL